MDDYNPKLYIKSNWCPEEASPELEAALQQFRTKITETVNTNLTTLKRKHNIPAKTRSLLRTLPNNQDFIVLPTDKNLGPAMENSPHS
jgi:rRNA-processing protein FCF1